MERYYRILEGSELPLYILLKDHRVSRADCSHAEDPWAVHRREVASFREVLRGGLRKSQSTQSEGSLLTLKTELAKSMLERCEICEWRCGANRTGGKKGKCGVLVPRIPSEFLHLGEEPQLVPSYTVFFAGCNFRCVYCQNFDISTNPDAGAVISPARMAEMIGHNSRGERQLGSQGLRERIASRAINVNWVGGDPTPNIAYVFEVLERSDSRLPQVWNSNMYLTERSMSLLDGVVDVYLTDFKYGNDACARRLSGVPDYVRVVSRNHLIAADQAEVIVRHLVLPNHVECCTIPVLDWISESLPTALVNVMDQYRPVHRAYEHRDLSRVLSAKEFDKALAHAESLGLHLV